MFVCVEGCLGLASERLVSAGGVIYRIADGGFEVALVRVRRVWCLPKGLVEEGEPFERAALREVREETGLDGRLVGRIGETNYSFVRDRRYFKTVHFFLFEFVGGSLDAHDREVDEVRWFPIGEAERVLAYAGERTVLLGAEKMLRG